MSEEKLTTMMINEFFNGTILICRLLLQLPTCVSHLEKIAAMRNENIEPSPFMLYSSIWGPRCGNKTFTGWLKVIEA